MHQVLVGLARGRRAGSNAARITEDRERRDPRPPAASVAWSRSTMPMTTSRTPRATRPSHAHRRGRWSARKLLDVPARPCPGPSGRVASSLPSWTLRPTRSIARSPLSQPYAGPVTSSPTTAMPTWPGSSATGAPVVTADFSDITRERTRRCAGSCTACPASTRSARRPARPSLGTRSIKTTAKACAIDLAIRMVDLTTLEGQDTPGKVRALAPRRCAPTRPTRPARRPPPSASTRTWSRRPRRPSATAASTSPRSPRRSRPAAPPLDIKLADTARRRRGRRRRDRHGHRPRRVPRRPLQAGLRRDRRRPSEACGSAPTSRSSSRPASCRPTTTSAAPPGWRCWPAADFIKTSTGKVQPAATLPVTLVMLEAVRDFREQTGRMVGVKPAGGIRTTKDAIKYLVMVNEIAGDDWLDPDWFRFGASTLLNDLLMQRTKLHDRPLLRSRLLHPGLIEHGPRHHVRVRPRPRVAHHRRHQAVVRAVHQRRVRRRPRQGVQDDQPRHRGGARRGRRGRARPTSTRRSRPPAGPTTSVWGRMPGRERAKYLYRIARHHPGARPRARRAGVPRQRQADQGVPRRRRPDSSRRTSSTTPAGPTSCEYAGFGEPTPARRRRPGHPVELPAADAGLEDRAGAGLRQHRRAQAGRDHPADRAAVRRDLPAGRPAAGRRQHRHRRRRRPAARW